MSDFLDCTTKDLTVEQMFSMLLTKTNDGEVGLRTILAIGCEENAIDCSNNSLPLNAHFMKMVGVSDCGKPALRILMTRSAIHTAIGFPEYADNATALGFGLIAGQIYFNTTSSFYTVVV